MKRLSLLVLCLGLAASVRADFALRDGDTIAFLGDSITAARGYTKVVEHYTLMRFPDRKVRFVNAGQGGDTAYGSLQRLDSDVFDKGATVLTVAFGINDIGWGTKADNEHRQKYLDGIREIVTRCQKRGVRVFICSPAVTAADPEKSETEYLQRMADDGIHLSDLGQLAMGYAMIKGLGAPSEVSGVVIDAAQGKVVSADNCTVTALKKTEDGIVFRRHDRGLPLNLGIFGALNYRWIPIPDGINGYTICVKGLPAGDYELRAEGRLLGTYSAERLAKGENIASATSNGWEPGGPWDAQSDAVKELVDARDEAWGGVAFRERTNGDNPAAKKLARQAKVVDDEIVALQRATAKPYPYLFEIKRAPLSAK